VVSGVSPAAPLALSEIFEPIHINVRVGSMHPVTPQSYLAPVKFARGVNVWFIGPDP
jgi:hypothetical protein